MNMEPHHHSKLCSENPFTLNFLYKQNNSRQRTFSGNLLIRQILTGRKLKRININYNSLKVYIFALNFCDFKNAPRLIYLE